MSFPPPSPTLTAIPSRSTLEFDDPSIDGSIMSREKSSSTASSCTSLSSLAFDDFPHSQTHAHPISIAAQFIGFDLDDVEEEIRRRRRLKAKGNFGSSTGYLSDYSATTISDTLDSDEEEEILNEIADAGLDFDDNNNSNNKNNNNSTYNDDEKNKATNGSAYFAMLNDKYSTLRKQLHSPIQTKDAYVNKIKGKLNKTNINNNNINERNHFSDQLLEKIILWSMPAQPQEKAEIEQRIKDQDEQQVPSLSMGVMISNMKKMSARMGVFFTIQYTILKIINWANPNMTVAVLILYTYICLHPFILVLLPFIYLLFGIMVPAYYHRHPDLEYPKLRRKKGKLVQPENKNDQDEETEQQEQQPQPEITPKAHLDPDDPLNLIPLKDRMTMSDKEKESMSNFLSRNNKLRKEFSNRMIRYNLDVLINLRDLQNLITDVIDMYDMAEDFIFGPAGFVDERHSTSLFITVLLIVAGITIIGNYIPWTLILISGGWGGIISCHPKVRAKLLKHQHQFLTQNKKKKVNINKIVHNFQDTDIILDEAPVISTVEIFELQRQGLTPRSWEPWVYTAKIFEPSSSIRLARQRPAGAPFLEEVLPPPGWEFKDSDLWDVDNHAVKWCEDRGLCNVSVGIDGSWVYDYEPIKPKTITHFEMDDDGNLIETVQDEDIVEREENQIPKYKIGEWRRRRLYRKCYRKVRAPLVPKRLRKEIV